ncbi:MAG: nucleoside-triphosphatase [Anaerolineales bacterium]
MKQTQRWIITGEIGAGKTLFCMEIVELARQAGLSLGGLISPGVFEDGRKVGINVVDLKGQQTCRLANPRKEGVSGPSTKGWSFVEGSVAWGNRVLAQAVPCDILIIDELGPLEFERGEGWVKGLTILDEGDFEVGLVVIRPHLLDQALERWPDAQTIEISPASDIPHLVKEVLHRFGVED